MSALRRTPVAPLALLCATIIAALVARPVVVILDARQGPSLWP